MIWKLSQNTGILNSQIEKAKEEISRINIESKGLAKYKDEKPARLAKLYLDVFNNIRKISGYYNAESLVKIAGSTNGVDIEQFFSPAQYKGIRYVDLLCQINLKDTPDKYLLGMLYEMTKNKPISISEIKIEKNMLNLTIRLYGL